MLFRNLGPAVKVTAFPAILGYLLGWFLWEQSNVRWGMMFFAGVFQFFPWPLFWAVVKVALVGVVTFCWVAVLWHRFVLQEDDPGVIPRFPALAVVRYFGWSIVIFLLVLCAGLLLLLAVGFVASRLSPLAWLLSTWLVQLVVGMLYIGLLTSLWYRFGLILPATALGRNLAHENSWSLSSPLAGPIIRAGIMMAVLPNAAQILLGFLNGGYYGELAVGLVSSWVFMMAGISILTTLYGHLVERRDLT